MMKDFVGQLRQLQLDRIKFQKQKDKSRYSQKLSKQQNKYQAYIISQMSDKNRFIGASNIVDVLSINQKRIYSQFFKKIKQKQTNLSDNYSQKLTIRQSIYSQIGKQQTISVDFVLVKLCTNVIKRQIQKAISISMKRCFQKIREFSKNKLRIQKLFKILQLYHKRTAFQNIRKLQYKQKLSQPSQRMFQQDFSMIFKNQKLKKDKCNNDQSYLSFIFDKENHGECGKCSETMNFCSTRQKQIANLKNQLSYLKTLLTQKNIEIKLRDQEILKLKQTSGKQISSQNSVGLSRNTSYMSEMQKCVFGVKRIIRNTNGSIVSNYTNKQQISKELLGKYMKQSFQLKQNIDLARQICMEIQGQLPLTYRIKLQGLLKVLTFNEDVSFIDQNN